MKRKFLLDCSTFLDHQPWSDLMRSPCDRPPGPRRKLSLVRCSRRDAHRSRHDLFSRTRGFDGWELRARAVQGPRGSRTRNRGDRSGSGVGVSTLLAWNISALGQVHDAPTTSASRLRSGNSRQPPPSPLARSPGGSVDGVARGSRSEKARSMGRTGLSLARPLGCRCRGSPWWASARRCCSFGRCLVAPAATVGEEITSVRRLVQLLLGCTKPRSRGPIEVPRRAAYAV